MKTARMLVILVLALGLTASVANADYTFGEPTNLGPVVNSPGVDSAPCISADGLSLYFHSIRAGGFGLRDLWVTARERTSDPWGEPVNLGPVVNSSAKDAQPSLSTDSLTLFFHSPRPGGSGGADLWVTRRPTIFDPWGTPVNLGATVNSPYRDGAPSISADNLELYFLSDRPGGFGSNDLYVSTRATMDEPWGEPVNLGPVVNSSVSDDHPSVSSDGLLLFFGSTRSGGYGGYDLWVTTRKTRNDPWGEPVNLGPTVNSSAVDGASNISVDGLTLFFQSSRTGGFGDLDIWEVSITPVVDFNGDGIVDALDMCIIVDHWGENYPLCDIGPMPWGDGIVDVQDLIVLAEHLFEDVNDPTLVAHWALDEIEGDTASDSANDNDGTVYGDPAWQPEGGMVDGALQLDGTDDYVSTPFNLDPAAGAFSIFAWIKGGAPGQVILSQIGGADWLLADPSEGKLMTRLAAPAGGRFVPQPLVSESVITDGHWHRVGFVWDGSNRILYVGGVEVASDTYDKGWLIGGLQIGAGKNLDPGTFFSGLIDDVRIYNRAVTP